MSNTETNDDPLVAFLKRHNIPVTRENYIDLAFLGDPPDPWTEEDEAELPEEFRRDAASS